MRGSPSAIIQKQGLVKLPEDIGLLSEIANATINIFNVVSASGTETDKFNIDSFMLGKFPDHDLASQKRIKSVLDDNVSFLSLITELGVAAWLSGRGVEITPFEIDSFPDYKASHVRSDLPLFIECKKLMFGTKPQRIGKVISKANKQIKATGEKGYGVIILDLTDFIEIPIYYSAGARQTPADVEKVAMLVTNSVQKDNSAISCVVIIWNELSVQGMDKNSNLIMIHFVRRSLCIYHRAPQLEIRRDHLFSNFGQTFSMKIPLINNTKVKQNRNGRCRCNSGLKFKHCCGKLY